MSSRGLLTAGYDGKLLLWNEDLTESKSMISSPDLPFTAMAVSRKKETVYLATLNSTVLSYSLKTGEVNSSKRENLFLIDRLVINEELNSLFVSGQCLHVEELSLDSLALKQRIPGPIDDQITDFAINDDGSNILIVNAQASMVIRSIKDHTILFRDTALLILPGFTNNPAATSITLDDENGLILLGTGNPPLVNAISTETFDTVRIWELPNSKSMNRAPVTHIHTIPGKQKALCGDSKGNLFHADYQTDKVTNYWQSQNSAVTAIGEADNNTIAVGYRNGIIEKYSTESTEPAHSTQGHDGPVVGISLLKNTIETIIEANLEEKGDKNPKAECRECDKSVERIFWLCPECQHSTQLYKWDSRKRFN